jgi:hypothetical protein
MQTVIAVGVKLAFMPENANLAVPEEDDTAVAVLEF